MAYNTFNPIVYKGLVLYLDAENLKSYSGSGLNWYDLTSNGNNGVLTNGATFSPSGNGSIQFDGINDYVDLGSNIQNYTEFTTSIWLNYNFFDSGHRTPIGDDGQDFDYHILFFGGTLWLGFSSLYIGDAYIGFPHNSIEVGTWYNFVITKDSNNDIKFYQNSIYFGGGNKQGAVNINKIGSGYVFDNVKVSNILFYNRSLTPAEILQNYNATKWRFMNDDILPSIVTDQLVLNLDAGDTSSYPGSGTTWYDLTVNNNDGALTNGVVYNSGSMSFDGIDDYINFSTTNLSSTGDITIDTFIRLNGTQESYADIFDYSHYSSGLGGFVIQQNAPAGANSFYFAWWNGSSFDFCYFQVSLTNTYFHLAITKNGGLVTVYINGVSSFTGTGSSSLNSTGRVMRIGANVAGGRYIKGSIGEFRIYDKALTSTEVLQNFDSQKNRYGL